MIDRRGFLKTLIAVAVATKIRAIIPQKLNLRGETRQLCVTIVPIPGDLNNPAVWRDYYFKPAISTLVETIKLLGPVEFLDMEVPLGQEKVYFGRMGPFPKARFVQCYDHITDQVLCRYDVLVRTV